MIECENVQVGYASGQPIIQDLSVQLPQSQVTAIIGPNGCGKSTLLRALCRLLPVQAGKVTVAGREVGQYGHREFAQTVALLPQHPQVPSGVTVRELVGRGRYPYQGFFGRVSAKDREMIDWAMAATDTDGLADVPVAALSGGQRQRVWLALTLAQDTPVVVLDEPTTYLDLAHQIELCDLIRHHSDATGATVVMVLHELGIAARVAHHMVAMKGGQVMVTGTPQQVLTEATCAEIFGLDAVIIEDPRVGHPVVAGRAARREGEEQ